MFALTSRFRPGGKLEREPEIGAAAAWSLMPLASIRLATRFGISPLATPSEFALHEALLAGDENSARGNQRRRRRWNRLAAGTLSV